MDFNPNDQSFERTMVWVRLSTLNFIYYDERLLKVIATAIGKPILFNLTIAKLELGNYARVCIKVDLSQPIKRKVWILDHWHEVEYESLNLSCASCPCYGHYARDCLMSQQLKEVSGKEEDALLMPEQPKMVVGQTVQAGAEITDNSNASNNHAIDSDLHADFPSSHE